VNAHEKLIAFLEVEQVVHQFVATLTSWRSRTAEKLTTFLGLEALVRR